MARSTYVYVVVPVFGEVPVAFTVKRELIAWLHRAGDDVLFSRVYRVRDGGAGQAAPLKVVDLLMEGCK